MKLEDFLAGHGVDIPRARYLYTWWAWGRRLPLPFHRYLIQEYPVACAKWRLAGNRLEIEED